MNADVLDQIISTRSHGKPPAPTWTISAEELQAVFATVDRVFLPQPVSRYIARLVTATHPSGRESTAKIRDYISYGASPRAAIAIAEAGRAHALISRRPTVGFEDVKAVASPVLNHRLILNYKARFDKVDSLSLIADLISGLDEAGVDLPDGVEIQKQQED